MKLVFIGGGAHRSLSILRGALADPRIFQAGEIHLYDLASHRAEAVGRLLQKTPEYRRHPVTVSWGSSLEEALEGASVVSVILMAGTALSHALGTVACLRHGYWGSDNVSPSGAFLGIKGAPILLHLARKMERHCPDAWLLDFANPVAVLSGMVNRHTRIKTLGVCAGFINHQWDLSRIFGKDEARHDIEVDAVGINHLSFIVKGAIEGKDLFQELDRVVTPGWTMPPFQPGASESYRQTVTSGINRLVRFYRELGVLIFSSEDDGMMHLDYDDYLRKYLAKNSIPSLAEIEAGVAAAAQKRAESNRWFESHVQQDLNDDFWAAQKDRGVFSVAKDGIFLQAMRGMAGLEEVKLVTSRLNQGAIEGFPDDAVVEYSQFLFRDSIRAVGRHKMPDIVHGLISGLAVHQTMLGDACATGDPKLLAHSLLAYPIRPYSTPARELCRELLEINRKEIPEPLLAAAEYLRSS